jgi:hypothetical protein
MARRDGDPDSADSSFSILAAPAPHLDGKYTIIGRVVSGMDLVDAVIRSAGETEGAPRPTLEVTEAIVMAPGAPLRSGSVSERSRIWMLAGCALNLAGLALAAATRRSRLGSIGLAAALVGFFGVFVGLIDAMNRGQVASATMLGALLTAVVIFRLMSGFERMLPTLEKEKA